MSEDTKSTDTKREQWSSNWGFILAAAGSAIGLGHIWKFPYLTGQNGGAAFVLIFLIAVCLIGFPIMLAEMAIGRSAQLNAVGSYRKLGGKKWTWLGVMGIVAGFIILSYYSVIGGWVTNYMFQSGVKLLGTISQQNWDAFGTKPDVYFENFISGTWLPILWHLIFMAMSVWIVLKGVSGGIEKYNKMLMPGLFILLIAVMIRALTLPGAWAGVEYYIYPDFSKITPETIIAAIGQVFFSLSLGMGCMITYGSYLSKKENLQLNTIVVPSLATLTSILAGFAIMPAVFAFSLRPGQGPGLMFVTLPNVFAQMPVGTMFAFLFFVLVFFAAITSSISLLEVIASYFIDQFHWKRSKAVILMASLMFLLGIPCSFSFGIMKDIKLLGLNFFEGLDYIAANIMLPLGGFFMCLFVSEIWGIANASREITNEGVFRFSFQKVFDVMIRWISPLAVLIILIDPMAMYLARKIVAMIFI